MSYRACVLDSPVPGPSSEQPTAPRLKVNKTLAYITSWSKGQASTLTYASLQVCWNTNQEQKPVVSTFACFRAPISPRKEPLYVCGAPDFVAAAKGIPLHHLALEGQGNLYSWSHRTVIINITQKGVQNLSVAPYFMTAARGHLYFAWVRWPL